MILTIISFLSLILAPVVLQIAFVKKEPVNDTKQKLLDYPPEYVTEDPRALIDISYTVGPFVDFILLMLILLSIEYILDPSKQTVHEIGELVAPPILDLKPMFCSVNKRLLSYESVLPHWDNLDIVLPCRSKTFNYETDSCFCMVTEPEHDTLKTTLKENVSDALFLKQNLAENVFVYLSQLLDVIDQINSKISIKNPGENSLLDISQAAEGLVHHSNALFEACFLYYIEDNTEGLEWVNNYIKENNQQNFANGLLKPAAA